MSDFEAITCMGFDAMRICMGKKPKTFTADEIIRWIRFLQKRNLA